MAKAKKIQIIFCVIVLLCVVFVLVYGGNAPFAANSSAHEKSLGDGWAFSIGDTTELRDLPVLAPSVKHSGWTLEHMIPEGREQNSALCVFVFSAPFTVYFNDEPIYEYGLEAFRDGYKNAGSGFHIIALPAGEGMARIEVPPMPGSSGSIFSYAFLMPGTAFLRMLVQDRALTILSAMILFAVFIYTLLSRRSQPLEHGGSTAALALLSICAALWITVRSGLLQFFTDNLIFLNSLDFMLFFLLPIAALWFVRQRLCLRDRGIASCLLLSVCFLIAASLLHVFRIVDFTWSIIVFHTVLIADLVCILISVFRARETQPHKNVLRVGVIVLVAGAFIELIAYYLISFRFLRYSLLEIALLVFTLCMFYVWNSESRRILEQLSHQSMFQKMAYTDELTGLGNRAAFERDAQNLFYSEHAPLYLFMIDLNELKKINDVQGHEAGDKFICNSGDALMEAAGENGKLFRFGGDEFIILLPGGDMEAAALYKRLQPHMHPNDGSLRPSISVGYAAFDPSDKDGIRSVLRRADKRMYRFKSKMHKK